MGRDRRGTGEGQERDRIGKGKDKQHIPALIPRLPNPRTRSGSRRGQEGPSRTVMIRKTRTRTR